MAKSSPNTARIVGRIAWRNVRRNWRHSLAALGTMAIGFVALALFQGYLDELLRAQLDVLYARNMFGEIFVRRPRKTNLETRTHPDRFSLDEREQAFIDGWIHAHAADVKTRVRALYAVGMAHGSGAAAQVIVVGHDITEGRIARRDWAWNAWAGRALTESDTNAVILSRGLGAILGCEMTSDTLATVMDPKSGRPIPIERPFTCKQNTFNITAVGPNQRTNALEVDVVGLGTASTREFDRQILWMPLAYAQELIRSKSISNVMILLHDPQSAPRLRADMRASAQAAGLSLEIVDWKDTEDADLLRRGVGLISVFRTLVVFIVLIIAGAAVLTSMMRTVRERTREIGTLRSLGYRGHHILAMFGLEAALLALYAGAFGLVLAVAISASVNAAHVTYKAGLQAESLNLRIGYSPTAYLLGFFFLTVVAVGAALVAARSVTSMTIATALSDG